MSIVRDFVYSFDARPVLELLQQFDISLPTKGSQIAILRFEVLSPDSFIWRLAMGNQIYYLYAEDYVPDLGYIRKVLNAYLENEAWRLITVKISSESSSANLSDNEKELLLHEAHSGFDKVFLAESTEDVNDALFSEYAPRGFILE